MGAMNQHTLRSSQLLLTPTRFDRVSLCMSKHIETLVERTQLYRFIQLIDTPFSKSESEAGINSRVAAIIGDYPDRCARSQMNSMTHMELYLCMLYSQGKKIVMVLVAGLTKIAAKPPTR